MHIEIIQRKKGKMYKAHIRKGGKHVTKMFERKYDAQRWAEETEALFVEGCRFDLTFQTLGEEWLENHSKTKNSTSYYLTNKAQLNCVLPILGAKRIREINYKHIELLVRHLINQNNERGSRSINSYLVFVRAVFNYGIKHGNLIKNPVKKEHFLPEPEKAYQYWQLDEASAFLEYAKKKYAQLNAHIPLIYNLALNTGMRFGEIIALKWDAVFLQGNYPSITVRRSICPRTKTLKETTKGKRTRHIGINDVLFQALQNAHQQRISDFVVSNQAGRTIDGCNFIKRHYLKDVREAGVTSIRFHDLRHTYASLFVMQGGSLYDLQKILGHQDMNTTERYAHLAKDYLLNKAHIVVVGRTDNVIVADFGNDKKVASVP